MLLHEFIPFLAKNKIIQMIQEKELNKGWSQ